MWLKRIERMARGGKCSLAHVLLRKEEVRLMIRVLRELVVYVHELEVRTSGMYSSQPKYLSPEAKELIEDDTQT